ncbi:hypothetical protein HYH02_008648 [Chlamydomonas schloesseri]|uniref:Uncharacterized protein n=1 Tax=Chlamydomonas schloesseri TaxID=2026947 RepID=A0A835WD13_9CHLO|nr:hypothetical protein HYH02_008648 [Chlamydomonas schloesseri]|eukprot:KAG2445180.1 hypothetical protein HYH02_008648 [Chlamydomonas schloesseri]
MKGGKGTGPPAPGAPGRNVTISLALALTCTVVRDLLDLVGSDEAGEAAGGGSSSSSGSGSSTVQVPGVPSSITPLGLRLLDEWALQRQAAAAAGPAGAAAWAAWLPAFLTGHQTALTTEAAAAADFLDCSSFLEVVTELQLARVVLADRAALDVSVAAVMAATAAAATATAASATAIAAESAGPGQQVQLLRNSARTGVPLRKEDRERRLTQPTAAPPLADPRCPSLPLGMHV